MTRLRDIAVIGCGPAGMATALFLRRAGFNVRIFERFDRPKPVGAELLLQPTGLAVLGRLGLRAQIEAAGARIDRLDGRISPRGKRILDVRYAALGAGHYGIGIHRTSLFATLHDAVLADGIDIAGSAGITAIGPAADGRPVIVDSAGRRSGPFDLAIVASGAQSALRGLIGGRKPQPFPYGALWTTLRVAGHGFEPAVLAQRYVAARRMVGVLPVGSVPGSDGAHAAFFWSLRVDSVEAWKNGGLSRWKDEVAEIWPEAGRLIAGVDRAETLQPAFYVHYTARRPAGLRLAVIGDAAHSTSPQLGQGANMGLLDALALADSLTRHIMLDDALAAYCAARRRHIRFYQSASHWLTPFFQSDSRLAAVARDLAMPAMARMPYLRRETAQTLAGFKTGLFTRMAPPE
jgi:salicylate hydroxylase